MGSRTLLAIANFSTAVWILLWLKEIFLEDRWLDTTSAIVPFIVASVICAVCAQAVRVLELRLQAVERRLREMGHPP